MVRTDRLLQFIAQLQSEQSATLRRRLLLRYIRKLTDARFVALFLLDKQQQRLVLLAHSGRRPLPGELFAPASPEVPTQPLSITHSLPINGLFGSVLPTQGLLLMPDLQSDPQSLPEECEWSWPSGHVLLSAVRENSLSDSLTGLLFLAFAPEQEDAHTVNLPSSTPDLIEYEGDLLLIYEASDKQFGWGYVERLNQKTLRPRWLKPVNGFNIGPGLVEANYAYLSAVDLLAKIDLRTGDYVWQQQAFQEQYLLSSDGFRLASVKGERVFFQEDAENGKTIEVDKTTGKILGVRN